MRGGRLGVVARAWALAVGGWALAVSGALVNVGCTGLVGDPQATGDHRPSGPSNTPDAGASIVDTERFQAFLVVWRALNPAPGQRQRCSTCHSGGGPGRPDHAQDDAERAYAAARTVIDPANPTRSKLYVQAQDHVPALGVRGFDATELAALARWIALESDLPPGPPPPPVITDRAAQYALALDSAALRIAQVPAHYAELADIDAQPDAEAQRLRYEAYVDAYLGSEASVIDAPLAGGARRPGIVQNVFANPDVWPNYPEDPPEEAADTFRLTALDFDVTSNRGSFLVYPSALSRLALQWIGFGGVRSSRNNAAVHNQDNYGAMDALLQTALEDRPLRQAFQTEFVDGDGTVRQTRACMHVPYAGYQTPLMHRQVCRAGAQVSNDAPQGAPVPGGLLGSRAFQRVEYGHYKFHTLRSVFRSFHCKDFPVFTTDKIVNDDDSAARALVAAPWNEVGTTPYCASCHASSGMNLMALTFWRFDDDTGVLYDTYRARRPTEQRVQSHTEIVSEAVDPSKYYYKDQVLDSLEHWMTAFVDDPDFTRCSAAQIYNFAMGRGPAWNKDYAVPAAKVDELLAAYEAAYGPGSTRDMTIRRMLAVALKSADFTHR